MAALLSSSIGDTDSVVKFINEAREVGIEVLPPDVNESGYKFTVIGDKQIRFGLGAIRNVGRVGDRLDARAREGRRPFTTFFDFCDRVDLRLCNKRVFEALIASGALDNLGGHRAQYWAVLDTRAAGSVAQAAGARDRARSRSSAAPTTRRREVQHDAGAAERRGR